MTTIADTTIAHRIAAIQERHNMTDEQCSVYLGVPLHTLRNWRTGKRVPAAVVYKLFDVLGLIEAINPALHNQLIPTKG